MGTDGVVIDLVRTFTSAGATEGGSISSWDDDRDRICCLWKDLGWRV